MALNTNIKVLEIQTINSVRLRKMGNIEGKKFLNSCSNCGRPGRRRNQEELQSELYNSNNKSQSLQGLPHFGARSHKFANNRDENSCDEPDSDFETWLDARSFSKSGTTSKGSMHGVTERQLGEDHQRKISCSTKVARKTKQGHLSLQLTVNSEVTGSKPT